MNIDQYKYNQSLLKISRLQIKDLHDRIVDLEIELANAKRGANILLIATSLLVVGFIFG